MACIYLQTKKYQSVMGITDWLMRLKSKVYKVNVGYTLFTGHDYLITCHQNSPTLKGGCKGIVGLTFSLK